VLTTALANKLARIAWSVLARHRIYEARVSIGAKATASKDNAIAIGNGATSAGYSTCCASTKDCAPGSSKVCRTGPATGGDARCG
jgi:hypothetical protein